MWCKYLLPLFWLAFSLSRMLFRRSLCMFSWESFFPLWNLTCYFVYWVRFLTCFVSCCLVKLLFLGCTKPGTKLKAFFESFFPLPFVLIYWERNGNVKINFRSSVFCCYCSVASDSLRPHGPQHARLPWPSSSPRACSNSCPLSWWCHPTISSSVIHFFSCLESFPASGSFPMSRLFASGGFSFSIKPSNEFQWCVC